MRSMRRLSITWRSCLRSRDAGNTPVPHRNARESGGTISCALRRPRLKRGWGRHNHRHAPEVAPACRKHPRVREWAALVIMDLVSSGVGFAFHLMPPGHLSQRYDLVPCPISQPTWFGLWSNKHTHRGPDKARRNLGVGVRTPTSATPADDATLEETTLWAGFYSF